MHKRWPIFLTTGALLCLGLGGVAILIRRDRTFKAPGHKPTTKVAEESPSGTPDADRKPKNGKPDGRSNEDVRPSDPDRVQELASRFKEATTWEARRHLIQSIPTEAIEKVYPFLFEVAEGTDVDAVRSAAVEKLEDLALRDATGDWVTRRFCARLPLEPRAVIRYSILNSLGHVYMKHPETNSFCFDAIADRMVQDEAANVRANAARVLGYFDRERALSTLRFALEQEKDPEVRTAIQRRISQIE